jgi:uncharacterized membrane protein (UPF0136 family)
MYKKITCWIVLLYGLLLMTIGISAYLRKGSLISLSMGGGLGFLIFVSAFLLFAKKRVGIYISVFLTTALAVTFGIRYTMTHHIIPALLCVLSGAMLLFLLAQSAKWKKDS